MFNFNHVSISVEDLEKTLDFYKKFGFEIHKEYHDDTVDIVMLKLNGIILEIFHYFEHNALPEHSKDLNVELKTIGNNHFALGVRDINEAKEFVEKNNLYNGEITIKQGRLGKPYFFIKDPSGILIEIIEED